MRGEERTVVVNQKLGVMFFPLPQMPRHQSTFTDYVNDLDKLSSGVGPIYLVRANENVLTDKF